MDAAVELSGEGRQKPTELPEHVIGKRIEYQNDLGTVKFYGPLTHSSKYSSDQLWLGVQWDNPDKGRHNGTVEGVNYFKCDDNSNSGSLLKAEKANFGINVYDGIHLRYFAIPGQAAAQTSEQGSFVDSRGHTVEYNEEIYFETIKKFKKRVEFVGFDRIWKKINDLQNLKALSLPNCNISDIGPDGSLQTLLPRLENLSLESNLLYDWNQVFLIGRELKHLQELSISGNRLPDLDKDVEDIDEIVINHNDTIIKERPIDMFKELKVIVLVNMNLTWKKLDKVISLFLNVEELILCHNKLNDFENLSKTGEDFPQLTFLNLEENDISSFESVSKFKNAPKLNKLILNKNKLNDLGKVQGFNEVQTIIIEDNGIDDFKILSQLNAFPKLSILRLTKNPIFSKNTGLHIRQRAIGEIKHLKNVNGSELKKYERKDCEIYYLRNAIHEYFEKSGQPSHEYDLDKLEEYCAQYHPRVAELMKMYGNPYDDGIKGQTKIEQPKPQRAALIPIKLNAFSGPYLGKPAVTKKFTDNTLITNLKAMLAKQFGIPANKQKIYCKTDPKDPFVPMDEDLKDLKFYGVDSNHEIWVGDTEM